MAGTDSTFSAAGSEQSVGSVGKVVNKDYGNAGAGNPNGDRVDNSNGKIKVQEDGFEGTFGKSTKSEYIQYNPNSFYPKS
jgi:hypothetical protein